MADTIELETKLAFLENHLNELSDVVYRQQKALDELQTNYEALKERIPTTQDGRLPEVDEKPPHY